MARTAGDVAWKLQDQLPFFSAGELLRQELRRADEGFGTAVWAVRRRLLLSLDLPVSVFLLMVWFQFGLCHPYCFRRYDFVPLSWMIACHLQSCMRGVSHF